MNQTVFQAIIRRKDGAERRRDFASMTEAVDAIWPALEASGLPSTTTADGLPCDLNWASFQLTAGSSIITGDGTEYRIVSGVTPQGA